MVIKLFLNQIYILFIHLTYGFNGTDKTTARWDEKHLNLDIGATFIKRLKAI